MSELHATLSQAGPSAVRVAIRPFTLTVDRPVSAGGADTGPMGGELFLAGLAGCFASNLLAAARGRGTPLTDARVDARSTAEGTPLRFTSVTLRVSASADPADLAHLVRVAEKGCAVIQSVRGAIPVTVELA